MIREAAPTLRITGKQVLYLHRHLNDNGVLVDHPERDWLWGRVAYAINGVSISLRRLNPDQLDILRQSYTILVKCRGRWGRSTRNAARRKLRLLDAWQARSVIDRLGDVVR